ncbi:MAG: GIY-YIG nuclease family protein [Verrucomicrobia bacterium]|nr:GIY-YIG nuclease family protein [Verrucomicrobiota bacterium]
MAWVYILRGTRGRYYIGATDNFDRRFAEHCNGKVHTTARLGFPLEIVCKRELPSFSDALVLERELKKLKNPRFAISRLQSG